MNKNEPNKTSFDPRNDSPHDEIIHQFKKLGEKPLTEIGITEDMNEPANWFLNSIWAALTYGSEVRNIPSLDLTLDLQAGDESLSHFNASMNDLIKFLQKWQIAANNHFSPKAKEWSENWETHRTYFELSTRLLDDETQN